MKRMETSLIQFAVSYVKYGEDSVLTWTCEHISSLTLLVFNDLIGERSRKMNLELLTAILVHSSKGAQQCRGVTSPNIQLRLLMKCVRHLISNQRSNFSFWKEQRSQNRQQQKVAAAKASWGTSSLTHIFGLKSTHLILEKHTNHFGMFMSAIVIGFFVIVLPSYSYPH